MRRPREDTKTHTEKRGPRDNGGRDSSVRLQTKETPGARKARRGQEEGSRPSDSTRASSTLIQGFRPPRIGKVHVSSFKSSGLWLYVQQPQKCPVSGRIGIETKAYLTTTTGRLPTGWVTLPESVSSLLKRH